VSSCFRFRGNDVAVGTSCSPGLLPGHRNRLRSVGFATRGVGLGAPLVESLGQKLRNAKLESFARKRHQRRCAMGNEFTAGIDHAGLRVADLPAGSKAAAFRVQVPAGNGFEIVQLEIDVDQPRIFR